LNFFYGELLCLTATVDESNFIFHTAFHACHACCSSDSLIIFLFPAGLRSNFTQTKSSCTVYGRLCPLRGKAVAAIALLFVRALFRGRLPRTPTRLPRARVVLTVISLLGKFIGYPSELLKPAGCRSECNKRQHQKESTKVGGTIRAYQGQALRVLKKNF
jgi:hypothetical protein